MKTSLAVFGLALMVTQGFNRAAAQQSPMSLDDAIRGYETATHSGFHGVPEDWAIHHVVYSNPGTTVRNAAAAQSDPRYWLQQIRQRISARGVVDATLDARTLARLRRRARRDWSEYLGSGATVGSGQFPAKYSFSVDGSPSCINDFVAFNTGLTGSATQASILAYNQLYKSPTCSGSVPATLWAFNTGGAITLSPVLSLDGTQLAFVQSSGGLASLVVLKWAAGGTVGAPVALASSASYPSCTAPCMKTVAFSGSHNDTTSTPFYDYGGSDTLYVGDAAGKLHKFHPVFTGTPAEVTTGGFPVTVSQTAQPLASPVYDSGLGVVFVGDGHVTSSTLDGEVHAINAATAAVTNSASVCHGSGFLDGPILDPSAGKIYFTCGHDVGGGACVSGTNACVRQFDESSISGAVGTPQPIGTQSDEVVPPGAFDNIYINAATPTGNLYVCGNPGGAPTLYRLPLSNNVMGAPVTVATLSQSSSATCSPVTEFYNSTTAVDWMFMGVSAQGKQVACTDAAGCVYSFNATSALAAGTAASAGLASAGGSSGLVIDNIGSTSSTVANVYYSTLSNQPCATSGGTGGCAVQASQNGLQ